MPLEACDARGLVEFRIGAVAKAFRGFEQELFPRLLLCFRLDREEAHAAGASGCEITGRIADHENAAGIAAAAIAKLICSALLPLS